MKEHFKSKKALILLVVIVVLFGVFVVVRNNQQNNQTSDLGSFIKDNGRASLMANASESSGKEFIFQQLGIVIDEPKGLQGLNYTEGPTLQKNDGRLYVTSDDFKAAAEACGQDASKSYFASVYTLDSTSSVSGVATVEGKKIVVGPGSYELTCSGDASTQQARVLSESTKLLKEALKNARPVTTAQD